MVAGFGTSLGLGTIRAYLLFYSGGYSYMDKQSLTYKLTAMITNIDLDADKVVRTDGVFCYNENSVCLNPNETVLYKGTLGFVRITTAQSKGQWFFGIEYYLGPEDEMDALFTPVVDKIKETQFFTQDEAIQAGIKMLKRCIRKKRHLPIINKILADNQQLTLF